jgi:bifunctional ADP-heptose synthase (sugar kinase/adenylyltransferase)
MCQKRLYKKPSELYRKGGWPLELQVPDMELPIQHSITEFKKINNGDECNWPSVFTSRYTSRKVFSAYQQLTLVDYVNKCSKLSYGMTYKQIRQLVYNYSRRLQCKFTSSWLDNKIAEIDWLQSFMKRHKNLMLCKPENTSLFRAAALYKPNVMEFFDNYERAHKSWNIYCW